MTVAQRSERFPACRSLEAQSPQPKEGPHRWSQDGQGSALCQKPPSQERCKGCACCKGWKEKL